MRVVAENRRAAWRHCRPRSTRRHRRAPRLWRAAPRRRKSSIPLPPRATPSMPEAAGVVPTRCRPVPSCERRSPECRHPRARDGARLAPPPAAAAAAATTRAAAGGALARLILPVAATRPIARPIARPAVALSLLPSAVTVAAMHVAVAIGEHVVRATRAAIRAQLSRRLIPGGGARVARAILGAVVEIVGRARLLARPRAIGGAGAISAARAVADVDLVSSRAAAAAGAATIHVDRAIEAAAVPTRGIVAVVIAGADRHPDAEREESGRERSSHSPSGV